MSATLGGLIKDYRLQKNISQLEIAFALGWKEPSRLSRIEQGRVGNPKRTFVNRLMVAMKLSREEKNRLMLVGNYIPEEEEVLEVRKEAQPVLQAWKYPAVMYDYLGRITAKNAPADSIYQPEHVLGKKALKQYAHVLELLFHPEFAQNKLLAGEAQEHWHATLQDIIVHFRTEHKSRTKERWYLDLVSAMLKNKLFRDLWNATQGKTVTDIVSSFSQRTLIHPDKPKKTLSFAVFYVPLREDPRFVVEFHTPADEETMKAF